MTERSIDTSFCTSCKNQIVINCVWEPGGMNEYGGFIVKCEGCETVQDIYVGRDVMMSTVRSGATLLERYDRDFPESKERAFQKYGLVSR